MAEEEDLQLDLALSSYKKRGFDEAFPLVPSRKRTLPLFVWDHNKPVIANRSSDGEVIGWPPVKSSRRMKKKVGRDCECTAANYVSHSMYVKVEMEGVGIARKIDLTIHHSYQSLTATLMPMFGKSCEENNVVMYKLTYQDKEGDWLLAGDVPWGDFVQSVRRLKLVKNE